MDSAKKRILSILLKHVGSVVGRDLIRDEAGISEWARRVRELSQEGWDIATTATGYLLRSDRRRPVATKRLNVSAKHRYRILRRDNSRCRRCGRTPDDGIKLVVDHIMPVDWGGETTDDNLWTLCEECNLGKRAFESDVDATAMKTVLAYTGARDRLRAYFELRAGQVCTREELQIVAGISEYARRIRELKAEGMRIALADARGDYIFKPK